MKLIKIFIAAALFISAGIVFAKSGSNLDNITEDRHISGFNAVNVAGSFDVYIVQGATESVKVDAPDDIIHYIMTEVNDGTLKIYNKEHTNGIGLFNNHKKIIVYVSIKDVNGISLSGSGNVYFKEGITANTLHLGVTGSGNLTGKLTAKSLESVVTGSGDLTISGNADDSKIKVTGSGKFSARNLTTTNTQAHVTGSGDANVNAANSLEASVTGSGGVHYGGNPKNVLKTKTGSGDISRF
jgi:hypothetical protein